MYVLNACMHMEYLGCHTLLSLAVCNCEKFDIQWFVCNIYTSSKLYDNKPWSFQGSHFFSLGPSLNTLRLIKGLFRRCNKMIIYVECNILLLKSVIKIRQLAPTSKVENVC